MISSPTICGCCGGLTVSVPAASYARPGLSSVTQRVGSYWSFRDTMIARLTTSDHGALAELKARDPQVDFSIALIDAWAVAGDVLTFYNERLSSETLLSTARETESLHLLADLVGYMPNPGVAASASLAFTMAEAPGAPEVVELPKGIKVQSTPGPGEDPLLFETGGAIEARPAWNAMRPRMGTVQALARGVPELYLAGTQTGLKPGDGVYFTADDSSRVFGYIRSVTPLPANPADGVDGSDLTRIAIDTLATAPLSHTLSPPPPPAAPAFPLVLAGVLGSTIDSGDLTELLDENGITESSLFAPLAGAAAVPKRILVFRASAGTFGKTAPSLASLPSALTGTGGPYAGRTRLTWADEGSLELLDTNQNYVFLDRVLEAIAAGSSVVLVDGDKWGLFQPREVVETAIADFAITGKSTRLAMTIDEGFSELTIRGTNALGVSEWLDLPPAPRSDALRAGDTLIALEGFRPGLQPGQLLAITGSLADGVDAAAVEMAEIAGVEHQLTPGAGTTIRLKTGLSQDYDRRSMRLNGNVAPATQGETSFEILGSGGATTAFPTYQAKQGPLTFVAADVPGGARPEITLRVNGFAWQRVPNLLDAGPADRFYTLALDGEGRPRLGFGDGANGALPSAGQDNISLEYRVGIGGRVVAGQLNMLMSRPLGLEGVTNPLPSAGGAGPESLARLRTNLPLYCRTLDRVVSLSDFADFALGYAGIAKARAERVKLPGLPAPGVVLTVAGDDAAEVPAGSDLHGKLRSALANSGIPFSRFELRNFRLRYFFIAARIVPDPARIAGDVLAAAEQAVRAAFGFEARDFAQHVFASQVSTVLQQVEGVEAVLLDRLYTGTVPQRNEVLTADPATPVAGAELLMLHPRPLDYLEVAT